VQYKKVSISVAVGTILWSFILQKPVFVADIYELAPSITPTSTQLVLQVFCEASLLKSEAVTRLPTINKGMARRCCCAQDKKYCLFV
jgi:hypothetical protein